MSNEITRYADSIDGFTDDVAGQGTQQRGGATYIKFTTDFVWKTRDSEIERDRTFILTELIRKVQRRGYEFGKLGFLETTILRPGELWPDIDAWNEQLPKTEWVKDFNSQLVGPWIKSTFVHLLDPQSLDRFIWVANIGTSGSAQSSVKPRIKSSLCGRCAVQWFVRSCP